jgi:hypothetical protein
MSDLVLPRQGTRLPGRKHCVARMHPSYTSQLGWPRYSRYCKDYQCSYQLSRPGDKLDRTRIRPQAGWFPLSLCLRGYGPETSGH